MCILNKDLCNRVLSSRFIVWSLKWSEFEVCILATWGSLHSKKMNEPKETLLYEILGVSTKATLQEISTAYRRQALLYHPDKSDQNSTHFEQIRLAYETLSNEDSRRLYDKHGFAAIRLKQEMGVGEDVVEALLSPRRACLVPIMLGFFLLYCMATPVLWQLRMDGFIHWPWWIVLAPLASIECLLFVGALIAWCSSESVQAARASLCFFGLALLQTLFYYLQVTNSVSWNDAIIWSPMILLEIALSSIRRKVTVTFLLRLAGILSLLILYPMHLVPVFVAMLPIYALLGHLFFDWWKSARSILKSVYLVLHPSLTVFLLHMRLAWKAVRWLSIMAPTYTILIALLLISWIAIPCMIWWHGDFVGELLGPGASFNFNRRAIMAYKEERH